MKKIIAPSILAIDYSQLSEQLDTLKKSDAQWLHYDVMDGHFVPNYTFGVDLLRGISKRSELKMDVHLMVDNIDLALDIFLKENIHCITIHYEVATPQQLIEYAKIIRSKNILAGISFKPHTNIDAIVPLLPYFDLVLVMGVEPGFGGQPFMENTPQKIQHLKQHINQQQLTTLIEVDGGINADTGKLCIEAGADVLVAGSYVFKGNIIDNIRSLCEL